MAATTLPPVPPGCRQRLTAHYGPCVNTWVNAAPDLLTAAAARWFLTLGDYHDAGHASVIATANDRHGQPLLLKAWPDRDRYTREVQALQLWHRGADTVVRATDDSLAVAALVTVGGIPGGAVRPPHEAGLVAAALQRAHGPGSKGDGIPGLPTLHDFVTAEVLPRVHRRYAATGLRQLAEHALPYTAGLREGAGRETVLHADLYREAFPDWSRTFMAHSARAVSIGQYAAHVVPGLLQTEDYARAVLSVGRSLRSEEQLEERVAARLGRQERLGSSDRPELWVVLDEAVLRRPVGGRAVMRAQLAHLLEAATASCITVQVLPFDQGEHDAMGGSLTVLTLPDGSEAAYTEGAHYGQLIENPSEVRRFTVTYDRLRAVALPPLMSLDMIRSVMEATTVKRVFRLDLNGVDWRKSSYSNQEGGDCVEVADGFPGVVPVRDSKDPHGPALAFAAASWAAFIGELKAGHRF